MLCLGEKKAIKCSSSLDTKETFGILTFIVPVYLYTLSPTLRTNNAENTWQMEEQAVDGNILLPASVAWLFLTCSLRWGGLRHPFSRHIALLIPQTREVKADLTLLFTCFQVDVVSDITMF